jgi:hypothetical protein
MNALAEVFLAILVAGVPADDLGELLGSIQQAELARVDGKLQQVQKAARQARGTPAAMTNKALQDQLRGEQKAIRAGGFDLPRLEPEKLAAGAVGLLWDPAPYQEAPRPRARTDLAAISRAAEPAGWYRMPWNTFQVDRVLSPGEVVLAGRKAPFLLRGLDTAGMGEGQTITVAQIVRVVGPEQRGGLRFSAVEVVDRRSAEQVLKEWAKSKPAKKPKPAVGQRMD